MYKAVIIYRETSGSIHRDRSDGYCFDSESDAREWADDYSLDRIAQMNEQGYDVESVIVEVIEK